MALNDHDHYHSLPLSPFPHPSLVTTQNHTFVLTLVLILKPPPSLLPSLRPSLPLSHRFWCLPCCYWEGRVQVPAQSCSRINVPAPTLAAVRARWSRHGAFVRTCHASSHYIIWALLIFAWKYCASSIRLLARKFSCASLLPFNLFHPFTISS